MLRPELTAHARRGRVACNRARAVLLAALGWQNKDIGVEASSIVAKWRCGASASSVAGSKP